MNHEHLTVDPLHMVDVQCHYIICQKGIFEGIKVIRRNPEELELVLSICSVGVLAVKRV